MFLVEAINQSATARAGWDDRSLNHFKIPEDNDLFVSREGVALTILWLTLYALSKRDPSHGSDWSWT